MAKFTISGYDYSTNAAWTAVVSGYNYSSSPAWINTSAEIRGAPAPFNSVRLAYDSVTGKNVLLLGTTSTVWSYPQFSITEVVAGFTGRDAWGGSYSSSFLTSETNITNVNSPSTQVAAYGQVFLQGGNSFAANAILGTNDNYSLTFETNSVNRLSIDTSGNVNLLTGALQVGSTTVITSGRVLQNVTYNGGTVGVGYGGTGVTSFTQYGILFGNNTGSLGVTGAGTTGQCLVATTAGAPAWGTCSGTGSGVTLQAAYNNSLGGTTPEIVLDAAKGTLDVQAYSGQTADLLNLRAYASTGLGVSRFSVTAAGAVTSAGGLTVQSGGASITGGFNNNNGNISNAGSLSGVTGITTSGGYTQSGTGTNTFTGAINASSINATGTVNSANSRSANYTSLTGASGDWFPLFTLSDNTHGMVTVNLKTYAHSSVSFTVGQGYGPGNTARINVLNAVSSTNGGYANITGIRVLQSGAVEIRLTWSTGPTVNVSAQIIGTTATPDPVTSLVTSASASPQVDAVTSLSSGLIRGGGNLEIQGNINTSGALMTGAVTRISSTGAGTLTTLQLTGVLTSTVATGTAPLTVASTTKVTNLNADLLDGLDSSSFLQGTITADDVTARINSGFYQTATATIAEGYPQDTNSWYHLLSSTHSNTGNYYAMQFAGSFYNSNDLFYRSTNGNGATGWNRIWHQGNDGASSGLDADTLDGIDSSAFITTASGSGNYIQNGTALQAASFNISGTGSISSTLNVNGYIQGNSKPIIQTTDGWLRLNPTNAFTSGIYANTGIFRTDGTLQVGSSGATLNVVSGGNFAYNTNTLFANTAGNVGIGTAAPTAGYKLDVQGAALIKTSSTSAFRIQDASNNSLLTADTTNLRLTVGTAIIKDTITNVSTFTNGSWTAGTTFAGASATSLIAADLNGDGVQDLLTRNNGTFGVHLNGGTGTLSSLSYTSAGTTGNAVAADIDGDGDKDVLVANTTTTVSLYKNDGTGTFAASGTVTFSNAIASIVMADLDGDGDQDIVAVGSTSSSGWAYVGLNNGTGTSYSISTVTSAVAYAKQVVIADINNDGNKDILIANSNAGTVSTFKNNGNATFATRVDVTVGSTITAITTTDIENDNDQDIVVTYGTTSGVLATLANNGTGTFATPLVYTTSTYPAFLVADDINADGYNDIVVGASGMVAVHRNSGLGSFGARSQYTGGGSSSFAVTLLDGDKDGDIDIAAGNTTAGGTVFWNDGIEFVTPVTQNLRASVQVAMTKPGDIGVLTQAAVGQTANLYQANDSDGNLLMAVSAEGKLSVGGAPVSYSITTVSDGTLTPDTMKTDIYAGVSGPRYNILNDFDGDGDKDIVTMNTYLNYSSDYYNCSLSIFKNNGDGTYGTRTDFAANSANNSSACYTTFGSADFDGDGDKDLAVIYSVNGSTATVYLYLNNGSGTFTAGTNYTAPFSYYYTEMAFADVDGDGDQDMAIGGNGGVSVYKNNGNATFAAAVVSSASSRVTGVKFADLDGDGDQDMAVASFADYPSNTAYLDVFKNNGTGTFTKASNTAGSRSWGITVGDYDGDGDIDIAMAIGGTSGDATTVRIYKNPGNGTFSTGTNFTGAGNTLSTGDLDGDGDQDILGSGGAVYRNDGTGAFGSFKTYINFPSGGSSVTGATTIGDIDGDGDNDLVSTYFAWNWTGSYVYTHTVYVLKNFGADSIGAAYAGAGAAHVYAANLNNDAYKDLVTNDAKGFTTHFRNANGTHTSTSYTVSSTNYVVVDAAPGDIDGDGDTDVVMAYYDSTSSMYGYIAIYKNNGSGVFTLFSTSNPGGYPYGLREILVDDLNGDGTAEIYSLYAYYSSPNYNVNVYAGTASGSSSLYSSSPNSSTDPNRMHLASGDFNNDGNKDLYVTTGLNLAVLRNNGSSITTTQLASDTTLATGSEIVVADVNRDGWKDVVLASYATATLNVLLNNNGTSFGSILIYNATKTTNSIINTSSADFDGDGDIDILAGSVLYKNNGLGNYGERVQTSIPAGTTAPMSIADFDGDGDIDIARDGTFYWSASGSYGTTTTSMISVRSTDATSGGLFIQGAINQTAKLFVIQDAKGSALLTVDGNGNLRVKGAITGGVGSPDYAENITVSDPMIEAADVVSMDPGKKESVVRSSVPYDDTAVGVISTSPGFVTNASESEEPDETQRPLALSGRVPVKVTDENGVIVEGDYLTTSSTPGYAMKATKEGHVIGRAMATFTGTEADVTECVADLACGKVLMFIDNSYYSPVDGSNLQANDMTLFGNMGIGGNAVIGGGLDVAQNLNVGGLASLNGLKVTGNANIDGNLTVKGTANVATLKVGKHILSGSDTPLVAIGSAAGQDGLVTIDGTDVAGTLNITVKARPGHGNTPDEVLSAGSLADVTFKNPYEFTPRIVISPTNQTSMNTPVYLVKTNTGWQLMIGQTAVDGAVYQFDYVIVGSQGQSTSGN
ncbi:MAG TPA: FG-GAP-like repeat-containing protein [Candidatus Saccharimonadales bacterium]